MCSGQGCKTKRPRSLHTCCPAPVVSENILPATICATSILIGAWKSTALLDAAVSQESHSHPDPGQKLFSKHKNLKVPHLVKSLLIWKARDKLMRRGERELKNSDNSSPRSGMSLIWCISCAFKKSEGESIKRMGLSPVQQSILFIQCLVLKNNSTDFGNVR